MLTTIGAGRRPCAVARLSFLLVLWTPTASKKKAIGPFFFDQWPFFKQRKARKAIKKAVGSVRAPVGQWGAGTEMGAAFLVVGLFYAVATPAFRSCPPASVPDDKEKRKRKPSKKIFLGPLCDNKSFFFFFPSFGKGGHQPAIEVDRIVLLAVYVVAVAAVVVGAGGSVARHRWPR